MIQPTVGRIVHYYPSKKQMGGWIETIDNEGPVPAIITHVYSEACVNLAVFDAKGSVNGCMKIPLIQPGSERPVGDNFCEWMPYQVKKETGSESGEKEAGTQAI